MYINETQGVQQTQHLMDIIKGCRGRITLVHLSMFRKSSRFKVILCQKVTKPSVCNNKNHINEVKKSLLNRKMFARKKIFNHNNNKKHLKKLTEVVFPLHSSIQYFKKLYYRSSTIAFELIHINSLCAICQY